MEGQAFWVKSLIFPTGPTSGQRSSTGFIPHKLISRLVHAGDLRAILLVSESIKSLCFGLRVLSGWSSCRVIPVSDLVLGPSAQQGWQVPLRPVTLQTKHTGIWHRCQQLRAIKSSHMIPIHSPHIKEWHVVNSHLQVCSVNFPPSKHTGMYRKGPLLQGEYTRRVFFCFRYNFTQIFKKSSSVWMKKIKQWWLRQLNDWLTLLSQYYPRRGRHQRFQMKN